MSASWVVAELRPLASGDWVLATRRIVPSLYQARKVGSLLAVEPDIAMVLGRPCAQELHISAHLASRWSQGPAQVQLCKWLNWLRAMGTLRFGSLDDVSAPQVIPAALSYPVAAISVGRPSQAGLMEARSFQVRAPREFTGAPKGSLLELVERIGHLDEFVREYAGTDEAAWTALRTPLYVERLPLLDGSNAWSFGALGDIGRGVWPQYGRVRITGIGQDCVPVIQDYPIDPLGLGWVCTDPLGMPAVDAVFSTPQDQEPLEVLDRLPALLRRILLEAHCARQGWEVDDDFEEAWGYWEVLLAATLREELGRLRHEFLRRLGRNGNCGHRPDIVRYMANAPSESVRQRREQAFQVAFGAMRSVVHGQMPRAAAAIDDAKPLVNAMAVDLGISSKLVRRALSTLAGNTASTGPSVLEIAHLFRDLGPHCPPPPACTSTALVSLRKSLIDAPRDKGEAVRERAIRVLFRAIGRSAALRGWTRSFRDSWESICDLHVEAIEDLAGLAERSVDVFLANSPEFDAFSNASSVTGRWLESLALDELTQAANTWHCLRSGEMDAGTCIPIREREPYIPPLHSCSWVANQMRFEVLDSKAKLIDEARVMGNCVSAYWTQVSGYALVVLSMVAADASRATLSLTMSKSGQWRVQEVRGPANESLEPDCDFVHTAESFCLWLADHPLHLDASAWECLTAAREKHFRLLEFAADPAVTVQGFPLDLQYIPLSYLPGAGHLGSRIRRVIGRMRKASLLATRASGVAPVPDTPAAIAGESTPS